MVLPTKAYVEVAVHGYDRPHCWSASFHSNFNMISGANVLLMASEDFTNISHVFIGATTNPTRGFSAFQFVPGNHTKCIYKADLRNKR